MLTHNNWVSFHKHFSILSSRWHILIMPALIVFHFGIDAILILDQIELLGANFDLSITLNSNRQSGINPSGNDKASDRPSPC